MSLTRRNSVSRSSRNFPGRTGRGRHHQDVEAANLRLAAVEDPVAPVSAFHGDKDDHVTGAIAEHVRRVGGGHVMITTQAALMLCLSHGRVDPTGWHLVVDEIPEIDACHKFNIPVSGW